MFVVWFIEQNSWLKYREYSKLDNALDAAKLDALYGTSDRVIVTNSKTTPPDFLNAGELLVKFCAEEMRDAARQQREAQELQVFPRVFPGL